MHVCIALPFFTLSYHTLQTPLYVASENGHTAVVEVLVKAGADVGKVSHVGLLTSKENASNKLIIVYHIIQVL